MDLKEESLRKIIGKLDPRTFLSVYPHSSALVNNLYSDLNDDFENEVILQKLIKQFSHEVTYPIPFGKPSKLNRLEINGLDPGLTLVKEKQFWEKQKTQLMKYCQANHVDDINDSASKPGKEFCAPFSVVLLADHLSKDPDEYFNHNYNVYYTGGNVCITEIESKKYLIRPKKYHDSIVLCLEQISVDPEWSDPKVESFTEILGPVFQVELSERFIVSRQKNKVSLFSIQDDIGILKIKNELTKDCDIPYFSAALHNNILCTTNADRNIDIVCLERGKTTLSGVIESDGGDISDNWCSAHFTDENTLCFADRTCIGFVDLRMGIALTRKWPVSELTELCEEVYCCVNGSSLDQYVSTTHQLLRFDSRACGFAQRWTHGITHSPALMACKSSGSGHDSIFIGSQVCNSVVFVENTLSEGKCAEASLPYLLPNLVDTFHSARFNGCCLDNTVASRFSMCLTGLCVVEDNGRISLLRQTSAGDIFRQSLRKSNEGKDIELTDIEFNYLINWEKECLKLFSKESRECVAASIEKDKHVIDLIKTTNVYEEPSTNLDFSKASWAVSKEDLMGYCDYLAPKILKEWELEDVEEWLPDAPGQSHMLQSDLCSASDDEEEGDITEKVAKWMEKYNEEEETLSYYDQDEDEDEDEVIIMDPELLDDPAVPQFPRNDHHLPSSSMNKSAGF